MEDDERIEFPLVRNAGAINDRVKMQYFEPQTHRWIHIQESNRVHELPQPGSGLWDYRRPNRDRPDTSAQSSSTSFSQSDIPSPLRRIDTSQLEAGDVAHPHLGVYKKRDLEKCKTPSC